MIYLASLWDANYRDRGQALINSLIKYHEKDFRLWVLTLEEDEYNRLACQTDHVTPIYIKSTNLEHLKQDRTQQEFLWMCASYFTDWVMVKYRLNTIAYIDSDCYLFHRLDPMYDEIGNAEIAVTPHRFTPNLRDRLIGAGEYNVGFVYFRNTDNGIKCLRNWRDQCLAWCYNKVEDGKYGDQAYLNNWPEKYEAHVIKHRGANLAPWNQSRYSYRKTNMIYSEDGVDVEVVPVLFYHFHGLGRNDYEIHPEVAEHIYKPYLKELEWIRSRWL